MTTAELTQAQFSLPGQKPINTLMNSLRPVTKFAIVLLGLVAAFAIAWVSVAIRQAATQGPEAQASAGMYAAGDTMLGVLVFGLLALLPWALALFWLRPVTLFWSVLGWCAVFFSVSGVGAVATASVLSESHAPVPLFVAMVRIGLMPLTALAMFVCAMFAPQPRARWMLLGAAAGDTVIFAGVVLVKFILPNLHR